MSDAEYSDPECNSPKRKRNGSQQLSKKTNRIISHQASDVAYPLPDPPADQSFPIKHVSPRCRLDALDELDSDDQIDSSEAKLSESRGKTNLSPKVAATISNPFRDNQEFGDSDDDESTTCELSKIMDPDQGMVHGFLPQIKSAKSYHDDDQCSLGSSSSADRLRVEKKLSGLSVGKPKNMATHYYQHFSETLTKPVYSKQSDSLDDDFVVPKRPTSLARPRDFSEFTADARKTEDSCIGDDDDSPLSCSSLDALQPQSARKPRRTTMTRGIGGGFNPAVSAFTSPTQTKDRSPPMSSQCRGRASSELSPPRGRRGDFGTPLTEAGSPTELDDIEAFGLGYGDNSVDYGPSSPILDRHEQMSFGDGHGSPVSPPASRSLNASNVSDISQSSTVGGVADLESQSHGFNTSGEMSGLNSSMRSNSSAHSSRKPIASFRDTRDGLQNASNTLSSASLSSLDNSSGAFKPYRPLPDQSAFDRSSNGGGGGGHCHSKTSPHSSPPCPATPMRTPNWALEPDKQPRKSGGISVMQVPLVRQNSLIANKVLLDTGVAAGEGAVDISMAAEVNFNKDFEEIIQLGQGSFAEVFRVKEKGGERAFAVKKTKVAFRSRKDRDRTLDEARLLKEVNLRHCKHIVQFIRAWQEDGLLYVQLEYASKGSLKDLIMEFAQEDRRVPDETIFRILHDAAAGLSHIHSFDIVHLDIKPANLLIFEDGTIKICDFGLAIKLGQKEDGREGDSKYMAKELLETPMGIAFAADIFSLGISVYEIARAHEVVGSTEMSSSRSGDASSLHTASYYNFTYQLPESGDEWHALREGHVEPLVGRPQTLQALIAATMAPTTFERPSADALLAIPEVAASAERRDEALLSAGPVVATAPINRTESFNPLLMGFSDGMVAVGSLDGGRVHTPTGECGFWGQSVPNRNHPFLAKGSRGQADEEVKATIESNSPAAETIRMPLMMLPPRQTFISFSSVEGFSSSSSSSSYSPKCASVLFRSQEKVGISFTLSSAGSVSSQASRATTNEAADSSRDVTMSSANKSCFASADLSLSDFTGGGGVSSDSAFASRLSRGWAGGGQTMSGGGGAGGGTYPWDPTDALVCSAAASGPVSPGFLGTVGDKQGEPFQLK